MDECLSREELSINRNTVEVSTPATRLFATKHGAGWFCRVSGKYIELSDWSETDLHAFVAEAWLEDGGSRSAVDQCLQWRNCEG